MDSEERSVWRQLRGRQRYGHEGKKLAADVIYRHQQRVVMNHS